MELFKILGTIAIDSTDAIKALKDTQQEGANTESKLGKVFSGLGQGAAIAGKAIATGLAVGATAMAGLATKALSASGELEQNMGGAEAVFGDLGKSISDMSTTVITGYDSATGKAITATRSLEQESKDAYKNMGLSQTDYLATANKMGALFKGAGFETQEALDLSSQAMQRAADVASIMGIDTSAAMEAVAGAAKGNFTMMDNLGVAMNDTAIAAYAASKGINKSTSEMTQQEKIGLAMEMFLEKTSYAAGNYAKENETLAGSLSTAKAAFTNFLAGSGDVDSLVSSFSNLANVVVKSLSEIAPRLTQGLSDLVQQVVPLIAPLLNQLLPVLIEGAVTLVDGLVAAMPSTVSAIMAALPVLIEGAVQLAVSLANALPQILQPILDQLPTAIEALLSALPVLIPALIEGAVQLIVMLCENAVDIIMPIIESLPMIIEQICTALLSNLPILIKGLIQLVIELCLALPLIFQTLFVELPAALWKGIFDGLGKVFAPLGEWFGKKFGEAKEWAVNAWSDAKEKWNGIKEKVSGAWNDLKDKVGKKFSEAKTSAEQKWSDAKEKWSGIKEKVVTGFNDLKEKVGNKFNEAKQAAEQKWADAQTKFNSVKDKVVSAFNDLGGKLSPLFSKAKDNATKTWSNVKSIFDKIKKGDIVGAFNDLGSLLKSKFETALDTAKKGFDKIKQIGKDLVTGLWNGINDKFSWLTGKIKSFASNVTDKLKSFFGIHSPSIVMRDEVGKQLAAGVAEGIEAASGEAEGAAEDMGAKILETAEKKLEDYKKFNKLTLADEVAFWEDIRELTAEGSEERLEADKKYLEAKENLDEALISIEEKLQETLKSTQDELANSFGLFGDVEFDDWMFGSEMIDKLGDQTLALEKYETELLKLKDKIGDGALFQELAAMGVQALPNITSINSMSDAQLEEFVNLYAKRAEIAGRVAAETIESEYRKELENEIGVVALNVDDLPLSEYATSITETVVGFFEGITSTITSEIETITAKLEAEKETADGADVPTETEAPPETVITEPPSTLEEMKKMAVMKKYADTGFLTLRDKETLLGRTQYQVMNEDGMDAWLQFVTQNEEELMNINRVMGEAGETAKIDVKDHYGGFDGSYEGRTIKILDDSNELLYVKKQNSKNEVTWEWAKTTLGGNYGGMSIVTSDSAFAESINPIGEKLDLLDPSSHQYNVSLSEADSAKVTTISSLLGEMKGLLAEYFPQMLANMLREIRLDSGVLVGELAPAMNEELGRISSRKDRGL